MGSTGRWNSQHSKRITSSILICLILFFVAVITAGAQTEPLTSIKVKTVVIDAGHGGNDPGAIGVRSKEKDVTLAIALRLGKYIKENLPDVKVVYTRDKDIFVPLFERADIANKNKADLFISIHANANPRKYIYGSETYVMGDDKNDMNFEVAKAENAVILMEDDYSTRYEGFDPNSVESYIIFNLVQRTHLNQSLAMAGKIQDQFRERARRTDRGVKQAGFLVLWRTSMPSVLVESGYITHPDEEKYLSSANGQDYLASAIFRAFRDYKQEIESSSNFSMRTPPQNSGGTIEKISSPEPPQLNEVYYKVQLFSSRNQFNLSDPVFSEYQNVEEYFSHDWYKYAYGRYPSYEEAGIDLRTIKNKFPDAFIIAVNGGRIIPLDEAKQLINK
jgi:N-acetylmuramoyl-L-alanine amidase